MLARALVICLVHPEIDAIHIAVCVPEASVMWMIARFARDILHRETAGNNFARGSPERMQIRLGRFPSIEKGRKRLSIDVDLDAVTLLRQFHLSGYRESGEGEKWQYLHDGSTS
jgi:hypothetical protein